MAEHMVFCVKLKKELPGLDEPPFDTELGQKVYDNVSLEAWKGWTEFCKMLLNEYRLNPARREDQLRSSSRWNNTFSARAPPRRKSMCPRLEVIRINRARAFSLVWNRSGTARTSVGARAYIDSTALFFVQISSPRNIRLLQLK